MKNNKKYVKPTYVNEEPETRDVILTSNGTKVEKGEDGSGIISAAMSYILGI